MAKKIELKGCPCCGNKAFWHKGNKETRMIDTVECLDCGLTLEGTYKPTSALDSWNKRAFDYFTDHRMVNIEGENL